MGGRKRERERESAFSERVYSDIVDLKERKLVVVLLLVLSVQSSWPRESCSFQCQPPSSGSVCVTAPTYSRIVNI